MVEWGKHAHLITWPPVLRTNTHHYTQHITLIPAHCSVLLLASSPPDWMSLPARQRLWWRTRVSTDPHTVAEAWCVSLQALQAQSRVWPQSIRRAPAPSAPLPLRPRTWDGRGAWWVEMTQAFLSFEIAVEADRIKPVCIIEAFGETLTGSRYSHVASHQKHRGFRDTGGATTETLAEDVNQTPDARRPSVLMLHECI